MRFRGLRLAAQFLTRLPVPGVEDFSPGELSQSAAWFPMVGSIIGAIVAAVVFVCAHRSHAPAHDFGLIGGAISVLAWVWLTGALHLDGLADLTDALAAAHRDPKRFLAVLADPHIGAFGVISVVLVLILKFAALATLSAMPERAATAIPLICAWARLGPLAWSRWLPPLKAGHGERFAWKLHAGWVVLWTIALLIASATLAPVLCVAPLLLIGWGVWLRIRLGGVTGDCLGAGIEVTETVLVLLAALISGAAGAPQ